MLELWKDIKGYEGLYQVSNYGNVKGLAKKHGYSNRQESIIKQYKNKKGYYKVVLSKNGKQKNIEVQRIVAEAFLNKNDFKSYIDEDREKINLNKLQVNHINEDKSDNKASNLEWCSPKYNVNYGKRGQKASISLGKKILQFDTEGNFIKEWQSIKQAFLKLHISKIGLVCKGRRKTAGGYIWKYKEQN